MTIVFDDRPDSTGKRRRRWFTFKRFPGESDKQFLRRVEAEQRKLRVKKDAGESDLVPEHLTVGDFLNRWLEDYAPTKARRPNG